MVKTHWVKRAVTLGAAVTLSLSCYPAPIDAAVICQETEMAGISLSLDKYYTTYYLEESQAQGASVPVATTAPTATMAPKATATPKAATNKVSSRKKAATPKVSKRWQTTGISIANDYVNIRRHPNTESRILGKLYKGSAAKILRNVKGGWVQIESGDVKGYIKKEYLAIGAEAQSLAEKYGTQYITVKEGTITLNVRSRTSTKSTIVTQIPEEERYNVEKLCGENWVRISIDDGRGYVAKEFVNVRVRFKKAISIKEERARARAKAAAKKAEEERLAALAAEQAAANDSSSSSSSSSSGSSSSSSSSSSGSSSSGSSSSNSGSSSNSSSSSSSSSSSGSSDSSYTTGSGTGAEIAAYAQKFVGNAYVYGGTSLTNGTDCSGFTMSVYAQFGYSIPRTSREQSTYGTSVDLSNVTEGDLIFYKNGSSVGHVALYIGSGKVVHASNPTDGIKISNMYYRQPCNARRIVG